MQELNETVFNDFTILESKQDGPWRVKAIGLTADELNANGRVYPAQVITEAVREASNRLTLGEAITGQVGHPEQAPHLGETVFNWTGIAFNGKHIILEGLLLATQAGKDLRALAQGGVKIGLSQRAKGDSQQRGNLSEVTRFTILGYDAVVNRSDKNAGLTLMESTTNQSKGVNMSEFNQQISEFIEAQAGTYVRFDESTRNRMGRAVKAQKPESFDEAKRLLEAQAGDYDALLEAAKLNRDTTVARLEAENAKLEEDKNRREVETFLMEAVKDAKYPKALEEAYLSACKAGKPANVEEAKALLESQRGIFDPLAASQTLAGKGFGRVQVMGPVIERATGYPEYAKASFALGQKLEESAMGRLVNFEKPQTQAERLTGKLLNRFDSRFQAQLLEESRLFEAETTSDLAIPYSSIRAVIAQAYPALVAANVFDFQAANSDPEKIGYEVFTGETGFDGAVTDEDFNSGAFSTVDGLSQSGWIQLAHTGLKPGTVVVNVDAAGALIADDGTNYVVDYARGRIKMLDGGSADANVAASTAYEVDYGYYNLSKGENQPIERAKLAIQWKTLESAPFRLGAMLTKEAIVYGRSQAGWDAVTRTIASLSQQVQSRVDEWLFYLALSASMSVANNQAASVNINATTAAADLIKAIGKGKVKISDRGYTPTAVIASAAIADIMSNSEMFSQAGSRADVSLNADGSIGRAKGLPVFEVGGGLFPDNWMLVVNRELVIHRVFQPMGVEGPFQVNDVTTGKLLPTQEYYVEEFNGSDTPVPGKSSLIKLTTS
jgi:hypothetical protein